MGVGRLLVLLNSEPPMRMMHALGVAAGPLERMWLRKSTIFDQVAATFTGRGTREAHEYLAISSSAS